MRRARTSPKSADAAWRLGPPSRPIVVGGPEAAPVLAELDLFLSGWERAPAAPGESPEIALSRGAGGEYLVSGAFGAPLSFDNPRDAANGLAGALVMVLVGRDPSLVCLHAGAARLGAGVVALVGDSGAGKSTVALMLAASGHALFGDDRIGIRIAESVGTAEAVSFGLAPKARLPLPVESDPGYARFIADRTTFFGEIAAYLRMRPGEQAPLGALAPLAGIAVLARGAEAVGKVGVERMAPAAAVRALVPHCYAGGRPAAALLQALERLARLVPVVRLSYAESRLAARHLVAADAAEPAGARHG